jgi:ribonuclease P/MRP protein subunit POP1
MSFLNSLVYTGTRVVGLSAQHHQKLEVNYPHFPADYVGVPAYIEFAAQRGSSEQAKWERTPKGKRINYESIGTAHPWISDWGSVVGDPPAMILDDLIPTDRTTGEFHAGVPWLFPFPEVGQLVNDIANDPGVTSVQALGDWLNSRRSQRGMATIDKDLIQSLFESAIIYVRIDMLGRGNPKDRATIYGFPTNEAASQRKATFESTSRNDEKSEVHFRN